jgi:hypothetical protein
MRRVRDAIFSWKQLQEQRVPAASVTSGAEAQKKN